MFSNSTSTVQERGLPAGHEATIKHLARACERGGFVPGVVLTQRDVRVMGRMGC